jgi:hypothetical protein
MKTRMRRILLSSLLCAFLVGGLSVAMEGATARAGRPRGFCHREGAPGSFGRMFDPVGKRFDVALAVRDRIVPAGRTPRVRLLNSGTADVTFGVSQRTQRWSHGSWTRMPLPKSLAPVPIQYRLFAESVSQCIGPATFANWPAGKDRWLLSVHGHGRDGVSKQRTLRVTFLLRPTENRGPSTAGPWTGSG